MPTYVYKCIDCDTKFEVFHKSMDNDSQTNCPSCDSENSKRLITAANFSGFSSGTSFDIPQTSSCSSGMCGLN